MDPRNSVLASYGIPNIPLRHPSNGSPSRRATSGTITSRTTSKRYSVTALYSMAAEQDVEVEDELAKGSLSDWSKNFVTLNVKF